MAEFFGGGDTNRVGPFEELYRVGLFDESVEWGGAGGDYADEVGLFEFGV